MSRVWCGVIRTSNCGSVLKVWRLYVATGEVATDVQYQANTATCLIMMLWTWTVHGCIYDDSLLTTIMLAILQLWRHDRIIQPTSAWPRPLILSLRHRLPVFSRSTQNPCAHCWMTPMWTFLVEEGLVAQGPRYQCFWMTRDQAVAQLLEAHCNTGSCPCPHLQRQSAPFRV